MWINLHCKEFGRGACMVGRVGTRFASAFLTGRVGMRFASEWTGTGFESCFMLHRGFAVSLAVRARARRALKF